LTVSLYHSASIQPHKRNLCINFSKKVTFQRGLCCDCLPNEEFDNPKNNKKSFIHSMTQGFLAQLLKHIIVPKHRHLLGSW